MVRAWFINNNSDCDKREELHLNPPKFVSLKELFETTGVEYIKLNVETYQTDGILENIKKERGYTYEDELICSKERLPNYEEKLKTFYTEHLHLDEEIRFCTEGCGFFDVRSKDDEWIRVEITPGDMLILPKGIYHRFTLDKNNYVKVRRFFIGSPNWTAHNRPADELPSRKEYLTMFRNRSVEIA